MTCKTCGKPNWAGCGAHVETVLGDVPKAERCSCREGVKPAAKAPTNAKATAATGATDDASTVGRFKRWLQQ